MNVGKTLFAQVMEYGPWKTFGRIIDRIMQLAPPDDLARCNRHPTIQCEPLAAFVFGPTLIFWSPA